MTIVLGIDLATADMRVQAVDVETGETIVELRRGLNFTGSGAMRTPPARRGEWARELVTEIAGHLLPSDTSHALKSGIDPVTGSWNLMALAAVDLPFESMPDLEAPGQVGGEVTHPSELGLPDRVFVSSRMPDG